MRRRFLWAILPIINYGGVRVAVYPFLRISVRFVKKKAPRLGYVLFRWQEWGDGSEVKQYVDKLLSTPEGLADFLAGFMSQRLSQSSGDYVAKSEWVVPVENIKKFTNLDSVKERVHSLTEEEIGGFSPTQLLAIETFRAGVSGEGSDELN